MGKRNRNHQFGAKTAKNKDQSTEHKHYEDLVRENELFVQYYKKQGICKEDDWDTFMETLKSNLPVSFRITASKGESQALVDIVEKQFLVELMNEDCKMHSLPWYPNKLAWQLELTRKDIRRNEKYKQLHTFLMSEVDNGTISRQEAVSMIPPLLLDVQSHHKVLDMCAAPGSKTVQLIEMLHADSPSIPTGYVVANDVDNKRTYMLVHQTKRLNSPCIAVTNHDAAVMPNFFESVDGSEQPVQFDRILCDVPCTGDGTMRKNPDIWMKWNPANAINHHGIQSRIAQRGLAMLAIGGKMVYSTCSMNPLENEAVIHRLLAEYPESLRLLDAAELIPELKTTPGMEHWKVGDRHLKFYDDYDAVPEALRTTLRPGMFPPKPEDAEKYQLSKCIRILPHYQNTGAFFVAVFEKTGPITVSEYVAKRLEEDAAKAVEPKAEGNVSPTPARKKRRLNVFREDPFVFFEEGEEIWPSIKEFYAISDGFDPKCLLTRCYVGKKKNVYLCSPAVRNLVIANRSRIKFINTGVKTFVRCDNRNMKCAFRLANEGADSIFPFIGEKRKISVPKNDLVLMLRNNDADKSLAIDKFSIHQELTDLDAGSCVINFVDNDASLKFSIVGWRGTTSFRAYVTKFNIVHYLRILDCDATCESFV